MNRRARAILLAALLAGNVSASENDIANRESVDGDAGSDRFDLGVIEVTGEQGTDWYRESDFFMSAGLRLAGEIGAYYLTDSSTWVTLEKAVDGLRVLVDGDPRLVNAYHVLVGSNSPVGGLAREFIDDLAGPDGQAGLAAFGRSAHGEPLYMAAADVPDTKAARQNTNENGD